MKKIVNWTFCSFFRTIGRTLAFILFGILLAILFTKLNIKIPYLLVKAYSFNNNGETVNLNLPVTHKKYFAITRGDLNVNYVEIDSDYKFYIVCNYYERQQCSVQSEMFEITAEEFETYKNDTSKYKFYDSETNKYYMFLSINPQVQFWGMYNNNMGSWSGPYYVGYTINGLLTSPNIDGYWCDPNDLSSTYNKKQIAPYNVNSYEVTFHLNGGTASYDPDGFIGPPVIYIENFNININERLELEEYIGNLKVKNDIAIFNSWYYDKELTNPYNPSNEITENIDLYASYSYTSIDAIINNVDFNEFTFPSDYEYAVISVKENFAQGLYIGLGFNFQYLDVYNYVIENQAFTNGSFLTLSSIGSKNNYYYYHLSKISDDTAQVIVIDKANLIKLGVDNVVEHYYTFRLSSNAYVEFTNDLTQVSYYIPAGGGTSQKLENQNISNNYDYTQKFILDNNSDLITIFMNGIKDRNMHIFDFFKDVWYKFRAIKLTNYLFILTIGAIIIALIKGGSRH